MKCSNLENDLNQLYEEAERLHKVVVEEAKKGNYAPIEQLKEFAEKLYTIIVQFKLSECNSLEELEDFSANLSRSEPQNEISLSKTLEMQKWFTTSVTRLRRIQAAEAPSPDPVIPHPPRR